MQVSQPAANAYTRAVGLGLLHGLLPNPNLQDACAMTMDTSPRTYRFLPADILTSGYRVVGKIMVTSTGTIGILNDNTHSILEVHDARLARLHMPTKLVDHF